MKQTARGVLLVGLLVGHSFASPDGPGVANEQQAMAQETAVDNGVGLQVRKLIADLETADRARQLDAIQELAELGPEAAGAVTQLILALTDENLRLKAAYALAAIGPDAAPAVPALIEALTGEDKRFRSTAAYVLGKIGPGAKRAVPQLLDAFNSTDDSMRRSAINALGQIGPDAREAVPALIEALHDRNLRHLAAMALGNMGPAAGKAVEQLMFDLTETDRRSDAASSLGWIGPTAKQAVPMLIEALDDKDLRFRQTVVQALGRIRAEAAVPKLVAAMLDDKLKYSAVSALGEIGPAAKDAIPALLDVIETVPSGMPFPSGLPSRNSSYRRAAITSLGKIGPDAESAIPILIGVVHGEESSSACSAAITALGQIGPRTDDVIPTLIEVLRKERLRNYAKRALEQIGEDAVPALIVAVREEDAPSDRAALLDVLGALGPVTDDVIPALIEAARDESTQGHAVRALGAMGAEAVGQLVDALNQNANSNIRSSAACALGRIGPSAHDAWPDLVKVLDEESTAGLRSAAVTALGQIRATDDNVLSALIRCLEDEEVRPNAVKALGRIGQPAVPSLIKTLEEESGDGTRRGVVLALERLGPVAADAVPALLVTWDDLKLRAPTARALGAMGSAAQSAMPMLTEALQDGSGTVRAALAAAMLRIDTKAATEALRVTPLVAPFDAEQAERTRKAWAEWLELPPQTINSMGITLNYIPPGEFAMGSPGSEDGYWNDKPEHRRRIDLGFYLSTHEVTVAQFRTFVKATGYRTEAELENEGKGESQPTTRVDWQNTAWRQTDDHPVIYVTWNDARRFCEWLGTEADCVYRLPTEAEWEYACRAGSTTKFYSGDDPNSLAGVGNTADATLKRQYPSRGTIRGNDGFLNTAPVERFKPNAFGLFDMHGNVWEWCLDPFDSSRRAASQFVELPGKYDDAKRVMRGGGWMDWWPSSRSGARNGAEPAYRSGMLGFRVVMDPGAKWQAQEPSPDVLERVKRRADRTSDESESSKPPPGKITPVQYRDQGRQKLDDMFGWMIGRWETPLYEEKTEFTPGRWGTSRYQQAFTAKWINQKTAMAIDTEHGADAVQARSPNSHRILYWNAEKQQFRYWEVFDTGPPREDTFAECKVTETDDKRRRHKVTYHGGGVEWTDTYIEGEDKMDRLLLHKNWSRPKTSFTKLDTNTSGGD